jgi:TonB family protein
VKSRAILMAFCLCLSVVMRAQDTGTAAVPQMDLTARPADLTTKLGNILAAAKTGDKELLLGLLKEMRIANPEEWFAEKFGLEKGKILSPAYTERVETDDQFVADQLLLAAKHGGDLYTLRLPDGPVAGEPFSTFALRASLTKPAVFYAASYIWKEEASGLHKLMIGFLTQTDGRYRRLPGELVWLLKETGIGTPTPVVAQTPSADNQPDARLAKMLNLIAAMPPPPPQPVLAPDQNQRAGNEGQRGGCTLMELKTGNFLAASRCQGAKLIKRVEPTYPPLARQTRISGTVRLHAIIGKDGAVQEVEVVSGHPLLLQAAMNAVKQWVYQPTLLDGKPVKVDTTVDVIFFLN